MEFSVMHLKSLWKLTFWNGCGRQGLGYCTKNTFELIFTCNVSAEELFHPEFTYYLVMC